MEFVYFLRVFGPITERSIFVDRPLASTTYTVYFTNVLLLVRVIYRSVSQSWQGMKIEGMEASSLFNYTAEVKAALRHLFMPGLTSTHIVCDLQRYNTIDTEYVDPRDVSKGGIIDIGGFRMHKTFPHHRFDSKFHSGR